MTRPPPPGKCVHCLKPAERLNWDHVFPKSWYPDTTSHEIEKWKIPSCIPCNTKYGALEKDFLIRVGLCLDPDDPACSGIVAKALRSLDPSKARNNKDRKARAKKRDQILRQMIPNKEVQASAVYPGFGADRWPGEQLSAIAIDAESHTKITEKIVRGILYLEESVLVGEDYTISTHVLHDQVAREILEKIEKHLVGHSREPGIIVLRATVPEDKTSSAFAIEMWGKWRSYAFVTKKIASIV